MGWWFLVNKGTKLVLFQPLSCFHFSHPDLTPPPLNWLVVNNGWHSIDPPPPLVSKSGTNSVTDINWKWRIVKVLGLKFLLPLLHWPNINKNIECFYCIGVKGKQTQSELTNGKPTQKSLYLKNSHPYEIPVGILLGQTIGLPYPTVPKVNSFSECRFADTNHSRQNVTCDGGLQLLFSGYSLWSSAQVA